jgi:predicted Zn-dependent peptidase
MRFFRTFFFLIVAASLAQAAELELERRVVEHTCANGIKLLILERHFSPTISIRMLFHTGSVDEVSGKTGLAHMFEHMMFKGTKTLGTKDYAKEAPLLQKVDDLRQAIDQEKNKGDKTDQAKVAHLIDQLTETEKKASELAIPNELWNLYEQEGASDLNAGTASDLTQYVVDVPANKLKLWAILDSDRLKNPVFRQFYSEREVVKEERRMRVDTNPEGKLYERFLATAFIAHPYRHPTIGWESDLDHLSVEDLTDFYHTRYTPDRLTISIVGDVDAQDVIKLVDSYFGDWRPPVTAKQEVVTQEPAQSGLRRETVEFDAEPHLFIGFHVPRYPDPDHFAIAALARLLGDGQSSRLYQALVQKKRLATTADTDPSTPGERYDSLFVISASPRYPHSLEDVEKAIFEELEKLKKTPIESWELEKVHAHVDTEILNTLQTNDGMASTLAYDQGIFGDWRYLLKYQQAAAQLTAKDLQRAAQRIFSQNNATIAYRVRKKNERKVKN